jgi:uncharacterized phage-associated protein
MKALKLVFFADRFHVRKYGRFITNDNYVAMKHGPVPSSLKDIAESNDFLDENVRNYSLRFISPVGNLELESIREVDNAVLSESDLEALQFAWETFGHLDQFQLRDLTHFYPEWIRFKDELESEYESCLPINLADFLEDPISGQNKCFELTELERSIRREQLTELAHLDALWR